MLPKESKDCLCKIVGQELLTALRLSLGLKRAIFLPSPYSSLYTSKDTGADSLVNKGCESKDGPALQLHKDTGQQNTDRKALWERDNYSVLTVNCCAEFCLDLWFFKIFFVLFLKQFNYLFAVTWFLYFKNFFVFLRKKWNEAWVLPNTFSHAKITKAFKIYFNLS